MSRILIVDDEPKIRKVLERTLKRLDGNNDLLQASDGLEAMKMAEKYLPEVILLDVMMPGLDGLEVCRRLKETDSEASPYIIMFSALVSTYDQTTGLEYGADAYLPKPASPELILTHVNKGLKEKLKLKQQGAATGSLEPETTLNDWDSTVSYLKVELAKAKQFHYETTLLMFEILNLGEISSRQEGLLANEIFEAFSEIVSENIRNADWAFRRQNLIGVVFSETSAAHAKNVADMISHLALELPLMKEHCVEIIYGIAIVTSGNGDLMEMGMKELALAREAFVPSA